MGVIPRSGAAQPRGQNKGICSNFTRHRLVAAAQPPVPVV